MLDTAVALLTAKLKLVGVAVAAAALSTSAVAVTTVSSEAPVVDDAVVAVEEGAPLELIEVETASPLAGGEEPGEDEGDEPTEEVVEEPAEDDVDEPAAPDDAVALPPCPADVKNHGAYVSSVARDKSVTGREHGKRVSAAAKSDCGKKAEEEPVQEPVEAPVEEPVEDEVVEAPEPVEPEQVAPAPKAERKAAKAEVKAERKTAKAAAPKGEGGGKK